MTMFRLCMGVDVSKDTLDIYWQNKSFKIQNNAEAITIFAQKEIGAVQDVFCVLEPTGGYERCVVKIFTTLKISVHTAHPNKVHAFAKASGHFAKTDKLDAILLHKYAKFISLEQEGDMVLDVKHQEIIDLRRLARALENQLHSAQCRIKQMAEICNKYLQIEIDLYKRQLASIQQEINEKIDNHPDLKMKRDLMVTMKGVGDKTASIILTELPEIGTLSSKGVASLTGLAPQTKESGKRQFASKISGGRFYARKALYMVALVAIRYDAKVKEKYQAMKAKGKAKKVALVAIMRDAIVILNAMLKKRQPYQAAFC